MKVIKRSGSVEQFDPKKIQSAIYKALKASRKAETDPDWLEYHSEWLTRAVLDELHLSEEDAPPTVEHIQDVVELILMKNAFYMTAKAYILYRAQHNEMRTMGGELEKIYSSLTFKKSADNDGKRENANINADAPMGTMLKYGSEGAKYFYDHYVIPPHINAADTDGDIHIHDKDFYALTETCCQIDLLKLFKGGFSTGHGYIREPNSIMSYASLAAIAIQANQNDMHGGQSIPNFDYAMADGVRKTYRAEFIKNFTLIVEDASEIGDDYESIAMYQTLPMFIEKMNIKQIVESVEKDGFGSPALGDDSTFRDQFVQRFHEAFRKFVTEMTPTPSVELQSFPYDVGRLYKIASQRAEKATVKATHQAMEAFVHNMNTLHSRAGAQVPFSSINYGTDISPEGRMVMKQLLIATGEGLGDGETSIFPVQIFKVKKGVNYNEGDPNYDLFKQAISVSAKRLFPNFSFLDAPFNLQYYKSDDWNSEVCYMGCRTRVMGNVYNPDYEKTGGRGNLSFTSINLPRIGIEAHGDIEKFYSILDERIDLCIEQLLHRFKIQCSRHVYNYPFLMGQGIWVDSEKLSSDDTLENVLKNGTLSIGFIGLAETLVALTGKHHGESDEAWKLGYEIIEHMRKRTDDESAKQGLNFSLIATPAEGLSGNFVKKDKAKYGAIHGVMDKDYYTNSFHIPVYYPISAFEKIRKEAPFHALTNGGHISYVELDGDISKNPEAFETVIRYMAESGIGYGSVNHPVDRDPVCGYNGIINDVCPRCGRHAGEGIPVSKLEELRKKYHNVPDYSALIS